MERPLGNLEKLACGGSPQSLIEKIRDMLDHMVPHLRDMGEEGEEADEILLATLRKVKSEQTIHEPGWSP
jgi:hypothetical protein